MFEWFVIFYSFDISYKRLDGYLYESCNDDRWSVFFILSVNLYQNIFHTIST